MKKHSVIGFTNLRKCLLLLLCEDSVKVFRGHFDLLSNLDKKSAVFETTIDCVDLAALDGASLQLHPPLCHRIRLQTLADL